LTEAELMQYRLIKNEIDDLDFRIKQMDKQKDRLITDKVTGSSKEFPYTMQHFNVTGIDEEEHNLRIRKINELQRKRNKKLLELIEKETEMHDYIYSIHDSEIRQIFTMRFIDGLTQDDIGYKVHMDRSTVSKKISKYLED